MIIYQQYADRHKLLGSLRQSRGTPRLTISRLALFFLFLPRSVQQGSLLLGGKPTPKADPHDLTMVAVLPEYRESCISAAGGPNWGSLSVDCTHGWKIGSLVQQRVHCLDNRA